MSGVEHEFYIGLHEAIVKLFRTRAVRKTMITAPAASA
jgi:hypothetical protein